MEKSDFNPLFSVEHSLHVARILQENVTFKDMKAENSVGLCHTTLYKIEKHGNYNVISLLKFAELVGKRIYFDGQPVYNLQDIGEIFRRLRQKSQLTILDIYEKTKIYPYMVSKIESGKSYSKATLVKYLMLFPIDIKIK